MYFRTEEMWMNSQYVYITWTLDPEKERSDLKRPVYGHVAVSTEPGCLPAPRDLDGKAGRMGKKIKIPCICLN